MSSARKGPVMVVGWLSALVAGTSAAGEASLGGRGSLRVLVFPDRPEFFAVESSPRAGFEREVLEGFARVHKLKLEVVVVPEWDALIPSLRGSKGDLIAGHFTETEERRQLVDFTIGLFPSRSVVINRWPRPPVTSPGQLRGERFGAVKGTAALGHLVGAGVPRTSIDDTLGMVVMMDVLRAGKVTAVVRSLPLAILAQRADTDLQIGMFVGPPSHFAFGVRKGDLELRDALNRHIELLRQTRQWDNLVMKYFGPAAVDILRKVQGS